MTTENWFELGQARAEAGRLQDALECFKKAIAQNPEDGQAYSEASMALQFLRQREDAYAFGLEAMRLAKDDPVVNANFASVLASLGRINAALAHFEATVKATPDDAMVRYRYGQALVQLGKLTQAETHFRQAIQLSPASGHNYYELTRLTTLSADDPAFLSLEAQIQQLEQYTPTRQANLHFAYGHAIKGQGWDEIAFEHFQAANELLRPLLSHNETRTTKVIESTVRMVDQAGVQKWPNTGHPSEAPIFLLSLPRTGSTMVEQIFDTHSQCIAVGEIGAFEQAKELAGGFSLHHHVPEFVSAKLKELGQAYLTAVYTGNTEAQKYKRFVDKSLTLFHYVGYAHLALPNAKLIYLKRNLYDVMYSLYSLRFAGIEYAYDLGEIGRRFRLFEETMDYWKQVLPAGQILEVNYEDLVNDLEGQTHRMLTFAGLPYEAQCLNFHQNDRVVVTASSSQVRQPLYRSSLKHWRPSDEALKPFYDGLGPRLTARLKEQG